jgi:hypothetical protein
MHVKSINDLADKNQEKETGHKKSLSLNNENF